ncbi:17808_t:CDS:2, partial [Gigaspora margarita]
TQDNEESFIDDNNDKLMDKLYIDIEALNFLNLMDLEKYINYSGEKNTHKALSNKRILDLATNLESENENVEDDDKALNTVEILEQYIVQNNFNETVQFEHDEALLKLQKEIKSFDLKLLSKQ